MEEPWTAANSSAEDPACLPATEKLLTIEGD